MRPQSTGPCGLRSKREFAVLHFFVFSNLPAAAVLQLLIEPILTAKLVHGDNLLRDSPY